MIVDEIQRFFHGDVVADDATLTKYSRDYSLFKVRPKVVVFPKDVGDLKNLVNYVSEKKRNGENISLTGRSAGTDMTGGPLSQGIIVSFTKYFNKIHHIGEHEAIVDPGVYFRDFEAELNKHGLLYPPYPASKDLCALGGMISNNSGGEKSLVYGKTEQWVRALNVVMSDGEAHTLWALSGEALEHKLREESFEGNIYRKLKKMLEDNWDEIKAAKPDVSKNSAGYYLWNIWDRDKGIFDLTKLIVGSQGTLGLVSEIKVALVKKKKHSRMAVVFLKDLRWAGDLVVNVEKFHPESIESYDDKTMEVAVKLWRQVLRSMKGGIISLGWQFLPEVWMVLKGGMPKMVVLIELTGDDEKELDEKLRSLAEDVKQFGKTHEGVQVRALRNEKEEGKYWTIRRQSFSLLHNNTTGKDTAPFIDDFVVKPEYLPEFLPKVNAILDKYKNDLIYTIAGHPGDGNFHIIPLMNLKDERVRALIPKISEEVYQLIFQYKGSITGEHNDGLIRTPYLEEMYGPKIIELFKEVKTLFDPQDIFNPGKKVGGSLEYSVRHIEATQ